jgi:membrane-associated phospholipid phosphatase
VVTYIYSALLADNVTTLEQSFAFHNQTSPTTFAGLSFDITPGSLKWSINMTTSSSSSSSSHGNSSCSGQAFTLRYKLSSLGAAGSASGNTTIDMSVNVTKQTNEPRANMTTYLFPLRRSSADSPNLAAKVVVFDVVVVDGVVVPLIGHSVNISSSVNGTTSSDYVLVLQFPAFNRSLYYDPSLGLGVLLGAQAGGGHTTSTSSSFLVVAVAVAIPVAVLAVIAALVIGTLLVRRNRRKAQKNIRVSTLMNNMYTL